MNKSVNEKRMLRRIARKQKGVVSAGICVIILLITVMLCCLGADIAHCVHVQSRLQAATDAGALAGVVEIAKKEPTSADASRAYNYAMTVTGANEADNIFLKNDNPDTIVNVFVDTTSQPKTVTVTASRRVNSIFASLLNFNGDGTLSLRPDALRPDALFVQRAWAAEGQGANNWLGTKSTAAPFLIEKIYPYQVLGLIPSLDHVPTNGPAKGQRISDVLDSNATFELCWNPQNSKNVGWIKGWVQNNLTPVRIGETWQLQNGVVNSTLSKINVGDVIGIPVTQGDVPMNYEGTILGVITVQVVAINGNGMAVKMHQPILFHGVKGTPNVTTSAANQAFLQKWQPWTVQLIE